jgi:hypothetical protein
MATKPTPSIRLATALAALACTLALALYPPLANRETLLGLALLVT